MPNPESFTSKILRIRKLTEEVEVAQAKAKVISKLKEVPEDVNTRGTGTQYHGTSYGISALDDNFYSPQNIYGQGLYTTDAYDVARGYSFKGKGGSPQIYEIKEKGDVKLYDIDSEMSDDIRSLIQPAVDIDLTGVKTMREVYDDLRHADDSADTIQGVFDSLRYNLEKSGYDGITHVGGDKTGTAAHKVKIYFNPTKSVELIKDPTLTGDYLAAKARLLKLMEVKHGQ